MSKYRFTEEQIELALKAKCNKSSDLGAVTVKEYLRTLLTTLITEGEDFSGKRPFGNSCWEYQVYAAFVKAKLVDGKQDEEGYLEDVDEKAGHKLLLDCVSFVFKGD